MYAEKTAFDVHKGIVHRDFLPVIFSGMDTSQAPYLVYKGFSKLISNSRRYLWFLIDSRYRS